MRNNEKILKEGSKAFELLARLKQHAQMCFDEGDFKYETVMSNIIALENIFKPYVLELEQIHEEQKQHELRMEQICADEGHIGQWKEDHYTIKDWVGDISDRQYVSIPMVRWIRNCTRCGKRQVTKTEPEEVKKLRKKKEIRDLEEKIKKMKSEL